MTERRRLEGRDGRIWRAYLLGSTQSELAKDHGLSQQRVSEIIAQARAEIPETDLSEARKDHLDVMRVLTQTAAEIMEMPLPPAYSNGRPIVDENGVMVRDVSGRLSALDRIVKMQERVAKVMGLDAPVKADVTVTEQAGRKAAEAASEAMVRLMGDDQG